MQGIDLTQQIVRTDLTSSRIWCADAKWANLGSATLIRANLGLANLTGANLTGANLTGANLSGASLIGANLRCANVRCANFSGAHLRRVRHLTRKQLAAARSIEGATLPDDLPDE